MLGPDRVIVAPVEVKLKYLILSLERSSTQHTHIVRESPHHVQLLARKDIVLSLIWRVSTDRGVSVVLEGPVGETRVLQHLVGLLLVGQHRYPHLPPSS